MSPKSLNQYLFNVYVYTYICMYVCMCVFMYMCTYVCIYRVKKIFFELKGISGKVQNCYIKKRYYLEPIFEIILNKNIYNRSTQLSII